MVFLFVYLSYNLIGVWGDDIEIQAISELYDRPIEIFAYSIEPLKTFHEHKDFNRMRNNENENENEKKYGKINISYHGHCHYNSLIPENEDVFYKNILNSKVGKYEELAIERLKRNKENKIAISENKEKEKSDKDNNEDSTNIEINLNKNFNKSGKVKYLIFLF